MMIEHSHNAPFVVASILIAMWTSYAAIEVSPRLQHHQGARRFWWIVLAALCAGGGIWSMHFTAMLAFHIPLPVEYDVSTTVLSLVLPVLGAALALYVVHIEMRPRWPNVVSAGVLWGASIVTMHYTGMAAMVMPAVQIHDPRFIAAAVVIAIGAATAALWITFYRAGMFATVLGSIIMGLAIAGMHYTGMAGLTIVAGSGRRPVGQEVVDINTVGIAVAVISALILTVGIIAANWDRMQRP